MFHFFLQQMFFDSVFPELQSEQRERKQKQKIHRFQTLDAMTVNA